MMTFEDAGEEVQLISVEKEEEHVTNHTEVYLSHLEARYIPTEEHWSRFKDIIPRNLKQDSIAVIGAGGIGSALIMQLAKIGLKNIHVFDFDVVDTHNVGPQGFKWHQVGKKKTDAVDNNVFDEAGAKLFYYDKKVLTYQSITEEMGTPDVLLICVDNMELRTTLYNDIIKPFHVYVEDGVEDRTEEWYPKLYIDARMSLGTWTIYTFPTRNMLRFIYEFDGTPQYIQDSLVYFSKEGIFTDEEGVQEPCTAREINFTGEAISAKLISSILQYYKNEYKMGLDDQISYFFDMEEDTIQPHKWMHTFNTLTWKNLLPTVGEQNRDRKVTELLILLTKSLNILKNLDDVIPNSSREDITPITRILDLIQGSTDISKATLFAVGEEMYSVDAYIDDLCEHLEKNKLQQLDVIQEPDEPEPEPEPEPEEVAELERQLAEYNPPYMVGDLIKFRIVGSNQVYPFTVVREFFLSDDNELMVCVGRSNFNVHDIVTLFIRQV